MSLLKKIIQKVCRAEGKEQHWLTFCPSLPSRPSWPSLPLFPSVPFNPSLPCGPGGPTTVIPSLPSLPSFPGSPSLQLHGNGGVVGGGSDTLSKLRDLKEKVSSFHNMLEGSFTGTKLVSHWKKKSEMLQVQWAYQMPTVASSSWTKFHKVLAT